MRRLKAFIAATGIALLITLASAAHSDAQIDEARACEGSAFLDFVCGVERPEDLARIGDTPWLIASGFAPGAGLKLIDTRTRAMQLWFRGAHNQLAPDRRTYPACAAPPAIAEFNARGISLRTDGNRRGTLHVVNHGGRESIEVFTVEWRRDTPRIRWRGCIPLPNGLIANSVATYSDGTVLFTVLTRPGTTITDFVRGEITGGVYAWRPGQAEVAVLPGTELPGNNGIETARDDRSFFVVAFGLRQIVQFDRHNTLSPRARTLAPGFMPDNIHWDGDRLLAAGMMHDEPACGGVRRIIDGIADRMLCHRGYVVAQLDPETLAFRTIAYGGPDPVFNGVSAAVLIEDELWLGSYQSDRLAMRSLAYVLD
jgi:hypothetical protein